MSNFYIIFILLINISSYGQSFSKKFIKNTEWFSDNKDSLFFKKDTIRLVKYPPKLQKRYNKYDIQYNECEYKYLNHLEYIKLEFKKNGNLNLTQKNWHLGIGYPEGMFTWDFRKKEGIISIYKLKKLKDKFKILNTKEIEIDSKHLNNTPLKTTELTMIRIH